MKKVIQLAALGACMVASSATYADGLYGGFNYSSGVVKREAGTWKPKPTAVELRLGKYITDTIAIEGRYSVSAGKHRHVDNNGGATVIDVELKNMASVFAKADYRDFRFVDSLWACWLYVRRIII